MPGRFNRARGPFVDTRPANLTAAFLAVLVAALSLVAARTVIRYFADSSRTRASIASLGAEISSLEDARQKAAASLARLDVPALAADGEDANEIALRGAFSRARRFVGNGSRGAYAHLARPERPAEDDSRVRRVAVVQQADALERRPRREGPAGRPPARPHGRVPRRRGPDGRAPVSAPPPTAVRKAGERIRRLLPLARAGGIRRSPWRARLPLFAVLAVLLVAAMAILIGYHAFYDERFKALEKTRAELAAKRDEAAEATRRVVKTEERLRALQRDLENFNRDVLGGRKERLAAVIEDVYQLTEKAGTVPGQ